MTPDTGLHPYRWLFITSVLAMLFFFVKLLWKAGWWDSVIPHFSRLLDWIEVDAAIMAWVILGLSITIALSMIIGELVIPYL